MVSVDLTKIPKLEVDEDYIAAEKKSLKPHNKGCLKEAALEMEKEVVKADGNCLFNCATLAIENTVAKP
jgi:hypothetical protein